MCYASRSAWPEAIAEFEWAGGQDNAASFASAFEAFVLARAGQSEEASSILADLLEGRRESHGA
jgi:hypothetical protein